MLKNRSTATRPKLTRPVQKVNKIIGPPGTGKTTKCIGLVVQAIRSGINIDRIAYVSFTRKAANEAAKRIIEKLSIQDEPLYFRTIHSLVYKLLELSPDDVISKENYDFIGKLLGLNFRIDFNEDFEDFTEFKGDRIAFIESYSRSRQESLKESFAKLGDGVNWFELKQYSDTLKKLKKEYGLLDFTDILTTYLKTGDVMQGVELAIIDEAQDLSTLQWQVIEKAFKNVPSVHLAGDDDQSIYQWSGADVEKFIDIPATLEVLEQSYRLPKNIFDLSIQISNKIKNKIPKKFKPQNKPGAIEWLTDVDQIDIKPDESWLFLARNSYLLNEAEAFIRYIGLPYKTAKGKSVNNDHLNSIQDWEKLRDGGVVSKQSIKNIFDFMKEGKELTRGTKRKLSGFPDEIDLQFLKENKYLLTDKIWHESLSGISVDDREYYLAIRKSGHKILTDPTITISTIHGVKGGEADNVVLLMDMSHRSYLNYQENPDQEHRVFYVAVTRSKNNLFLIQPQTQFFYEI